MKGTLKLTVLSANLVEDTDLIGKMDPYVVIEIGSQKQQGRTANGAGCMPVWNQDFIFNLNGDNLMNIKLSDEDYGPDDFLGETTVDLSPLPHKSMVEQSFALRFGPSGKHAGTVRIRATFEPAFTPF